MFGCSFGCFMFVLFCGFVVVCFVPLPCGFAPPYIVETGTSTTYCGDPQHISWDLEIHAWILEIPEIVG